MEKVYTKISFEKKIPKFVLALFALGIVINNSYFMWDTYPFTTIHLLALLYKSGIDLFIIVYFVLKRRKISFNSNKFIFWIFLFVVLSCIHFMGETIVFYSGGELLLLLDAFIMVFFLKEYENACVFYYLVYIYAFMILPSTLYFVITQVIGINIPFYKFYGMNQGKIDLGLFYELRPFGLIINAPDGYGYTARLCGIYDEPGVVGTVSALLLGASIWGKPRFRMINILLLIEGVLSFSFAFYLLFFLTICFWIIKKGMLRSLMTFALISIFVIAFFNIDFDNEQIKSIQNRISFTTEKGLAIENDRYDDDYIIEYKKFIEEGDTEVLFGNGYNSSSRNEKMASSSVFTRLIYDYGFLGTILYIGVFVCIWLHFGINKCNLPFVLVFFASIYQRPYVLVREFFVIYVCALSYLNRIRVVDCCKGKNCIIRKDTDE